MCQPVIAFITSPHPSIAARITARTTADHIIVDVLACMEDVRLAEMWSQGMFIDRGHGLDVVVIVLHL